MPLVLLPIALVVLSVTVVVTRFQRDRGSVSSLAMTSLGVILIAVSAFVAYRQGITADETGGAPPSSIPLALIAVSGVVFLAFGVGSRLRRAR